MEKTATTAIVLNTAALTDTATVGKLLTAALRLSGEVKASKYALTAEEYAAFLKGENNDFAKALTELLGPKLYVAADDARMIVDVAFFKLGYPKLILGAGNVRLAEHLLNTYGN